jgi:hypothetical protein
MLGPRTWCSSFAGAGGTSAQTLACRAVRESEEVSGFRRSRALVLWAGSAASAVGLVDAREIAGAPRIIDTLEGVIRRPGAAARPALPPADAGGP